MYDQISGYDTSIDIKTDSGLIRALSWIGLANIIRNRKDIFENPALSNIILSKDTFNIFSELMTNDELLTIFCSKAFRSKFDLYNHPTWNEFLQRKIDSSLKDPAVTHSAFRSEDHYLNYLLGWSRDIDWSEVYSIYSKHQNTSGYVSVPYIKALDGFFKQNPLCARTTIESELFESDSKPDVSVRVKMYSAYIKAGFLDKKKARKIRSEPSENVSLQALSELMMVAEENPSLYPNYYQLILQFTDVKHTAVQNKLAESAPYSLLYAFVGFESKHAKYIIEKRMQDGK